MNEEQLHNIIKRTTLIVRDMAKSKRWYEDVLGMTAWMDTEFVLSGQGLAAGKAGDKTHLVIMKCQDPKIGMIGLLQWVDPIMPAPPVPTEVTFGSPTFVVEAADAADIADKAAALGTLVHTAPYEWSTRGASGEMKYFIGTSVFDPDGYFYECNQVIRIEPAEA